MNKLSIGEQALGTESEPQGRLDLKYISTFWVAGVQ